MIRIVAMSDSHRKHARFRMPPGDIFIHAGDFSNFGSGVEEFAVWYWNLPYAHKFVVLGNHEDKDAPMKRTTETWRKLFGPTLLNREAREVAVDGQPIVIYGAAHGARAFEGAALGVSVLVTHEPPLGVLDRRIGSPEIAALVSAVKPALHVFGHVHQLGGQSHDAGGTHFINAATRVMTAEV